MLLYQDGRSLLPKHSGSVFSNAIIMSHPGEYADPRPPEAYEDDVFGNLDDTMAPVPAPRTPYEARRMPPECVSSSMPVQVYGYHDHDDVYDQNEPPELDAYDRALLAEPTVGPHQLFGQRVAPRISLDPRRSLTQSYGPQSHQPELNGLAQQGSLIYRTPPQRLSMPMGPQSASLFVASPHFSNSSTIGDLPSSPTFQASQRRTVQGRSHRLDRHQASSPQACAVSASLDQACRPQQANGAPTDRTALKEPVVQGISLVSPSKLPDRFQSIFPYRFFNAVQSKCFSTVFNSSSNLVLSAPTGSGKTVILELAVCQLVSTLPNDQFKIVYMAPTKSLCSERFRDWNLKFRAIDLACGELTGDTDNTKLRGVQAASIIITTPEKWDATTRKWRDHFKLMHLVKLFLIDEVHILKESRGASLEAVVSRMKSVSPGVRFIALSATVPNSKDIARWLGKDSAASGPPAELAIFGEEFRPVKLQKHVYGYPAKGSDFAFDSFLDTK